MSPSFCPEAGLINGFNAAEPEILPVTFEPAIEVIHDGFE